MQFTSLSHTTTGYNTQLDYTSVDAWRKYCKRNKDIVWSRLLNSTTGLLVASYFKEDKKNG